MRRHEQTAENHAHDIARLLRAPGAAPAAQAG
jgi:hypothetical protein